MNNSFPAPLKEQIGKGGFAFVFRDPRNPTRTCIKKFKEPVVGDRVEFLRHLSAVDVWARPSEAEHIKAAFSWPLELFGDQQQVLGYTMPLAPPDAFVNYRAAGKDNRKLFELSYITTKGYFNKAAISASDAPEFGDQDRIELAISACDAVLLLHGHGLVYRDVSSRNMSARQSNPRSVFVLDADSISTVDYAAATFIVTPGWEVADGLDPMQVDRAKLALLVFRLLVQMGDVKPPFGMDELEKRGRRALGEAITRAYNDASAEAINDLVVALRRARSVDRNRRAWESAVESGFARRIVREASAATTPADFEILKRAQSHLDAEAEIEAADLKTQKKLTARLHRLSSFLHDTLPTVGMVPPPRTAEELHQLAFDAQFMDIAVHLSKSGLPGLASDPLVPSIADRALFEADRPGVSATALPGKADVRISWPHSVFCNAMEITLDSGSGTPVSEIVTRDKVSSTVEREIRLTAGGQVTVLIRPGVATPTGQVHLSFAPLARTKVDIPPAPKPPRPAVSRPTVAVGQVQLLDPEEEERQRAELARAARRRRIKRTVAAAVALIVLGGGVWYWASHRPAPEPPPPTMRIFRH